MDASLSTVGNATRELERLGYLVVKRRGGRGVAHAYSPAFERSQPATTFRQKVVADYNQSAEAATKVAAGYDQSGRSGEQAAPRTDHVTPVPANELSPSMLAGIPYNPRPRAPAAAPGVVLGRFGADVAAALIARIGAVPFHSWLSDAEVAEVTADTVLVVSHRADQARAAFEDHLLKAFQSLVPSVKRVSLVTPGQLQRHRASSERGPAR